MTDINEPKNKIEIDFGDDWNDEVSQKAEDVALRLKRLSPNQLTSIGVAQLVAGKSDEIICPYCGNGSGDSHTGLTPIKGLDYSKFHCFKCGKNFDNLDLFAKKFNLDIQQDFKEVLRRADNLSANISVTVPKDKTKEISPNELALIIADIVDAQKHIEDLPLDDRRGLTIETLKHFGVGFLRYFIHPKSKIEGKKCYPSPRLIIPTSDNSYNAILLKSARTAENKKYKTMNAGKKNIFNLTAIVPNKIIVVVEGEIDAMSIWQATDGNVNIIALGGAGQSNLTKFLQATIPATERKNYSFVVLFDNDSTGIDDSEKLVNELLKIGCPAVSKFLDNGDVKVDANDILINEGDVALNSRIEQIISAAQIELDACHAELQDKGGIGDGLERLKALPQSKRRDEQIIAEINNRLYLTPQRKRAHMKWVADSLQENADLIFQNDPVLDGLVGYDEFYRQYTFLKPVHWHKENCTGYEWKDVDDKELSRYLQKTYQNFKGATIIDNNLTYYSRKKSFHPVKQYLESLHWDGVPRAETYFSKFLNADDTPYTREITLKWLLGAIARIYHEGCDFQFALVLHGKQGIGKGYCLRMLGQKWYVSLMDSLDDSHAKDAIERGWIVEIEELAAGRKAELNAQKAFLSSNTDTRRRAWARRAETTPRHCVFAITVNDEHFLRDFTGNRRYKIVESHSTQDEIVEGLTAEYVNQVWAEAFHIYQELFKDGFNDQLLRLSREVNLLANAIADKHLQDDGLQGEIENFLDTLILPPFIWFFLTKEERRKFFAEGKIALDNDDLKIRIKTNLKRPTIQKTTLEKLGIYIEENIDKSILVESIYSKNGAIVETKKIFYGTMQRTETCAAEIFNECFGNDKRKSTHRINEVLSTLNGWQREEKRNKKFAGIYGDQKIQYWRSTQESSNSKGDNLNT